MMLMKTLITTYIIIASWLHAYIWSMSVFFCNNINYWFIPVVNVYGITIPPDSINWNWS